MLGALLTEPWQWTVASGVAFLAVWLGYPRLAALVKGVGAAPAETTSQPAAPASPNVHRVDTLESAINLFENAGDTATAEAIATASPKVLFPASKARTDKPPE